jgi:Cof subfamily protein (haloacid dehalogenase superfamily)
MGTIYISDLDGTLVNDQAELSDYTLKHLQAMLADGLPLTVASARSIVSIQQMLAGLELPLPVICFNGAFLTLFDSGQHEIVNSIETSVARSIYECLPEFNCIPYISTYTGTQERVYYERVTNAGMQWYLEDRFARKDPRFRKTDDLLNSFENEIICMTIINRASVLKELSAEILARCSGQVELHQIENQYSPGWHWLTVHDARATKDQAIVSLKQHCGLQDSRVVVFGDNDNDVKMFKDADYAVAVGNATAEIKSLADEVIGNNNDDSVVDYLLKNWRTIEDG